MTKQLTQEQIQKNHSLHSVLKYYESAERNHDYGAELVARKKFKEYAESLGLTYQQAESIAYNY